METSGKFLVMQKIFDRASAELNLMEKDKAEDKFKAQLHYFKKYFIDDITPVIEQIKNSDNPDGFITSISELKKTLQKQISYCEIIQNTINKNYSLKN